jgi:hypothetical protein
VVVPEIVGLLLSQSADIVERHFGQRRLVVQLDPLRCRAPDDSLSWMTTLFSSACMVCSTGERTHSIHGLALAAFLYLPRDTQRLH